jgi:hypothetical protein
MFLLKFIDQRLFNLFSISFAVKIESMAENNKHANKTETETGSIAKKHSPSPFNLRVLRYKEMKNSHIKIMKINNRVILLLILSNLLKFIFIWSPFKFK